VALSTRPWPSESWQTITPPREFSTACGPRPLTRAETFVAAAQAFLGVEEDPR
jgi:hypothetical protein